MGREESGDGDEEEGMRRHGDKKSADEEIKRKGRGDTVTRDKGDAEISDKT